MVIISDVSEIQNVYFPKTKEGTPTQIRFYSELTHYTKRFGVKDISDNKLYYQFSLDFSDIPMGEYEYTIYNVRNEVLEEGLIRIGDVKNGDIIYSLTETYTFYNPETGEGEIIYDNSCEEVAAQAFSDGYVSGTTDGYSSGYTSGYTDGFNSGYTKGTTDGFNSGYTSGHTDGYDEGYEKGQEECESCGWISVDTPFNIPASATQINYHISSNMPFDATAYVMSDNGDWTLYAPTIHSETSPYDGTLQIPENSGTTVKEYMIAAGLEDECATHFEGYVIQAPASADCSGVFEEGFESGYTVGFESGITSCSGDCSGVFEEGYQAGLQAGYSSGKTDGYNSGLTVGYNSGYTNGYNSGYTVGYQSGWTDGYTSGSTPTPTGEIVINAPTTIPASATDFTYSIVSNLDGDIMVYRNNELWNSGSTFHSGTTSYRQGVWGSTANTVVYRIDAFASDSATSATTTVLQVPPTPSGYTSTRFSVEMLEDGNINWEAPNLYYDIIRDGQRDEGYQLYHSIDNLKAGDIVEFYVNADNPVSFSDYTLTATGKHNVYGNIMSIVYADFEDKTELTINLEFANLFLRNTNLISAENLILPATTLANGCYYYMFLGCSSLTKAPELLATTLAEGCCNNMFAGCTSLTKAPELLATTLASDCYFRMFDGCTSLVEAPVLPATTLAPYCYSHMFEDCSSLTKAPELPATTLVQSCYSNMFNGCTNLNYIKCLATENISNGTGSWVLGVSATGDFWKMSSATWSSGKSGIPSGWNVINN